MNNKVCIIILNFNSFDFTHNLITNLANNGNKYPIIVVDNDSTDKSYEKLNVLCKNDEYVSIIKSPENKGYATGNNYGIKFGISTHKSKYLAILNPDVTIFPAFIENMVKILDMNSKIAAVTGIMLNSKLEINPSVLAWKIPTGIDDFFLNSGLLTRLFNPVSYKELNNNDFFNNSNVFITEAIPGCCFLINAEIMKNIGYFDEKTFLYCEERILAKKIKDSGYFCALSLNNYFIHDHDEKVKRSLNIRIFHFFELLKSRYYFNIAYNETPKFIILPLFIFSAIIGFIEVILMNIIDSLVLK